MSELYTDHAIINWVLEHCQILHLGINDGDSAYVVPVHFGYQEDTKGHYTIYIHGSNSGKKGHLLTEHPKISFETDDGPHNLTYTPPAHSAFSPAYRSVMGNGTAKLVSSAKEKQAALRLLIHHYVKDIPVPITEDGVAKVPVWRIDVDELTAKIHHPLKEWQTVLGINVPVPHGLHYDRNGSMVKKDKQPQAENNKPDTMASASIKK